MKSYAGIGSRSTPPQVLVMLREFGRKAALHGYTLNSGRAAGADYAFEQGAADAGGSMLLAIPWAGFGPASNNGTRMVPPKQARVVIPTDTILAQCLTIASFVHPAWGACSPAARLLHARNVMQIWGEDLKTPVEFVLCYAPLDQAGQPKGGTRTAILIAKAAGIPVFNLAYSPGLEELSSQLAKHELDESMILQMLWGHET